MNRYSLRVAEGTEEALFVLRTGVTRVGATGRATSGDLVFGCMVETAKGEAVHICAEQRDLEYKFEVFAISAKVLPTFSGAQETCELRLTEPVEVLLLETQDWLDPGIRCEGSLGQDPIAQCQGRPGEAPESALASCRYFGGIELCGANGVKLIVATLAFPYAIHISAIQDTGAIHQDAYVRVRAGVA